MSDSVISQIFTANLSFSALLLAVQGILISLYLRAEHETWKRRFRILLMICGATFFVGILGCILSVFYLLSMFPFASTTVFNLIVGLFLSELAILGFEGLFLVMMLVIE